MSPPWPDSLRARLLVFLLVAIALSALLQGWVAYRGARAEADEIFDYHMQQMALSLRGAPHGPYAPPGPPPDLELAGNDDFIVQVWTANGLRVFRSPSGIVLPPRAVLGFSNLTLRGATYRVYSLQTPFHVIQVAQDMALRQRMAGTLALRTIAPVALLAPLLMLVVWWVVRSSLAPVARVRRQLATREAADLREVDATALPEEIRPLVQEFNLLLARVRQAFEAQQHFVADAAHELRSPLAALKLQLELVQRADQAPARTAAIERLHAGIDRATRMIEQLLILARQEAPTGSESDETLVLATLVRQIVGEQAGHAQECGIDLGLDAADESTIQGQAEALRILLRNLIDNAIKYTPAGGRIDLGLQRVGDRLSLRVEDSGPGIPTDERSRVLDRFYRVAGSAATGSGLGLAIVKAIAERHGATLHLESSSRLGGLCVQIDFPARPAI